MPSSQLIKPDLPSAFIRWVGAVNQNVAPTTNTVVAIPMTHDWGPMLGDATDSTGLGGADRYDSFMAWENVYGDGATAGRDAVLGAFLGMNVPGGNGAGAVVTPRMATGSAAFASLVRGNTTPAATALTLTAKYKGTRGNNLSAIFDDDPVDATRDRLRIAYAGAVVESYSYLQTDVASLAAMILARPSRWLSNAVANITGVALAAGTASFAGGNDGATVTITEYTGALSTLEFKNFGILSPYNLTDAPTKVAIASWVKAQADSMRPIRFVHGGAPGETVDNAIAELTTNSSLRDEHIVRVGVGTWHDDVLNKDVSTAQLAPRIAGVLAARGLKSSLTSAELGGLHVVGATGPTTSALVAGRDQGVTMFKRVSGPNAELAIAQGVTTYVDRTQTAKPYKFFSEPRIVGLLDNVLREITEWGERIVIGDLTVDDDTRLLVFKEVMKILNRYVDDNLATPGTPFCNVQNTDNDPSLDDAIPFQFGFRPNRTANFLIGEGRIN